MDKVLTKNISKTGTVAVTETAESLVIGEVKRLRNNGLTASKKSVTSAIIVKALSAGKGEG